MVARLFDNKIWTQTSHSKRKGEEAIEGINHFDRLTWLNWMKEVSKFKYAVHLMPTHAAGTFALNCAYWGIPCIGYRGLDTQEELHPHCTVSDGNLEHAREIVKRLVNYSDFYEQCSKEAREKYKECFSEEVYIYNMNKVIEGVLSK